jgi:hypothetical protein
MNDTWTWDGTTWTQLSPTHSPDARENHAMAYDSIRGKTVLFGGTDDTGTLGDTWEWDGIDWTQRTPTTNPPAQSGGGMSYDSARGVSVLGFSPIWEWDGTNWTQKSAAHPASSGPRTYDSRRHETFALGNIPTEWDGRDWTQSSPTTTLPARTYSAAAYDSLRGVSVLFGGQKSGYLADTWEW